MKSRVYLNSAFLLRAAIGFSRHLTSAGEDSYSFNLYSIVCRISCTYFHLIRGFRFFSQKTSASMSLLLPVSSKNEGNLEAAQTWCIAETEQAWRRHICGREFHQRHAQRQSQLCQLDAEREGGQHVGEVHVQHA